MKSTYIKTKWIDNKTPVNASNLNKIEDGISTLFNNCLGYTDIKEGRGISVSYTKNKEVELSVSNDVVMSKNITGIEYIFESELKGCGCNHNHRPEVLKKGVLYLVLDTDTKKLKYIYLNGLKIFEVDQETCCGMKKKDM